MEDSRHWQNLGPAVCSSRRRIPKDHPGEKYPIIESSSIPSSNEDEENVQGFSSGLEKRSVGGGGAAAPDGGNRVRFRLQL